MGNFHYTSFLGGEFHLRFIGRRLFLLIPTLIGVSLLSFFLIRLAPGDPIQTMLGLQDVSPETEAILRESLGLNDSLIEQYRRYLFRSLQGDFGRSIVSGIPVVVLIQSRLPATLELAVIALLLAVFIAIPFGVTASVYQNLWVDNLARLFALFGVATPVYWLGLILIIVFSINLGLLPVSGYEGSVVVAFKNLILTGNFSAFWNIFRFLILPAVSLSAAMAAILTRMTRSSMLEVLRKDFINTARAKGLNEKVVIYRHALRNALIPVITIIGLQIGTLMGGAVLTETIFAWPGIGRLVIQAVNSRDYPIIQVVILMFALIRIVINLVTDLIYVLLDPRIRYV